MYGMLRTGVAAWEWKCPHTSKARCDNDVSFLLLLEVAHNNARQGYNPKDIEIKHISVNTYFNVLPVCSLRSSCIVYQDIKL